MKFSVCSTIILMMTAILVACASPTPIPPTIHPELAPTVESPKPTLTVESQTPTSTSEPLKPTTTIPRPTRPPSVATIIFETDSCRYEGPQTLPVSDKLTVTWRIKTIGADVYTLTAFTTEEQKSREELISSQQGLDIHRPALPAGQTLAGNTMGLAGENKNISVRSSIGPLKGFLYFSCWVAGEVYDVLGPIELK